MSAEAYRDEEMYRGAEPDMINIRRNPYLVDYEQQRRLREQRLPQRVQRTSQGEQEKSWEREVRRASQRASQREQELRQGQEVRRVPRRAPQREQRIQQEQEMRRTPRRTPQGGQEMQRVPRRTPQGGQEMQRVPRRMPQGEQTVQRGQGVRRVPRAQEEPVRQRNANLYQDEYMLTQARRKRAVMEKKRAAARRKRIVRMQRMVLFSGVFCIALLCGILYMKRIDAKTIEPDSKDHQSKVVDDVLPVTSSSGMVQGLPATEFAKHPEWEENFLTPNEYSRPGDALESVNNIFVHYTANPNTSAAQNRSYFEQLKDTHITSASAHFIIGYNGEIVQCIPLDEIAYAVQTRNFDSISIECCYKSTNGSFTQETYDSLIELLAWLTDVYDLTTDDILRHYDCGGKKCPIYYTEHEDAWERLKKDVGEKL